MSRTQAGLLVAGVLVLAASVGGFVLLRGDLPSTWLTRAHSVEAAASEYGADGTPEDCVARAIALYEPCPRLLVGCATRANLFAAWCLKATEVPPSAALCNDVPPSTDVFGTRDWKLDRCGPRGRDEGCGAVASTLQRYCGSAAAPAPVPTDARPPGG